MRLSHTFVIDPANSKDHSFFDNLLLTTFQANHRVTAQSQMARHRVGPILAYSFGTFCLLSALPFLGIPFPNSRAAQYYIRPNGKNEWIAKLTGDRISPKQAGYFGATTRILLGAGLISQTFRAPSCAVMGAIVGYGTIVAIRDSRPLLPQFGMLSAIAAVWLLG